MRRLLLVLIIALFVPLSLCVEKEEVPDDVIDTTHPEEWKWIERIVLFDENDTRSSRPGIVKSNNGFLHTVFNYVDRRMNETYPRVPGENYSESRVVYSMVSVNGEIQKRFIFPKIWKNETIVGVHAWDPKILIDSDSNVHLFYKENIFYRNERSIHPIEGYYSLMHVKMNNIGEIIKKQSILVGKFEKDKYGELNVWDYHFKSFFLDDQNYIHILFDGNDTDMFGKIKHISISASSGKFINEYSEHDHISTFSVNNSRITDLEFCMNGSLRGLVHQFEEFNLTHHHINYFLVYMKIENGVIDFINATNVELASILVDQDINFPRIDLIVEDDGTIHFYYTKVYRHHHTSEVSYLYKKEDQSDLFEISFDTVQFVSYGTPIKYNGSYLFLSNSQPNYISFFYLNDSGPHVRSYMCYYMGDNFEEAYRNDFQVSDNGDIYVICAPTNGAYLFILNDDVFNRLMSNQEGFNQTFTRILNE